MNDLKANMEPLLSIRDLKAALPASMDRSFAVNGVSLDLHAEEILCIIGESGSGKSVTANAIMGLLPRQISITQGQILYRSRDLLTGTDAELRALRGKSIAMIFQDPMSALNPLMTIGRQIEEMMEVHGEGTQATRADKVVQLLTEVGLPRPETIKDQYPFRLSGGQRQRVMIAMAMALDPEILIADEPTTALDVTTQAQILGLIKALQARKKMGVIFITHDFGVVEEIADRVVVMRYGEIVEQGDATEVLRRPTHDYTRKLINAVPRLERSREVSHAQEDDQPPVLMEVRNLSKVYPTSAGLFSKGRTITALDDVSFDVRKGQTLGIVGESGSGKSTLARQIVKLADSSGGSILFQGRDIAAMSDADFRPLRASIQMIFQDPYSSLNPRHTIGQILTAGRRVVGATAAESKARALGLLDRVGLGPAAYDRFPHEFSGGQRQRVGIARALMMRPMILVADESVSALDVSIQAEILKLLAEIQRETRVSIVFITHDLRIAHMICDELIVMHQGKIVEMGPTREVFWSPKHSYTQKLIEAVPGAGSD
jgi:peptide/nickel transport system ATP-binding protein